MTLRALVTRPEEDAAPLAAALAERGIDVTLEPLLAIRPLAEAPIDLTDVQALLFTSANGVRSFAELAGARGLAGWRELPAFAVGNATAAAAHSAGFARVESAAGDVAALAKLAAERLDPKAGALFHAAGSAVAGDLAGLLEQAGFTLRREMLYEARPADQLSPATVTNLGNGWFDLVLFFSPRTAATFATLARAAGAGAVNGCGKAAALCLSQAVATAARELPWREVQVAARPELTALLDLIDRELAARAESAGKENGHAGEASSASAEAIEPTIEPPPRRRSRLVPIVVTAAIVSLVVALGDHGVRLLFSSNVEYVEPSPQGPAVAEQLDALDRRVAGSRERKRVQANRGKPEGRSCRRPQPDHRPGVCGAEAASRASARSDAADEAIGSARAGAEGAACGCPAADAGHAGARPVGPERADGGD